MKIRYLAVLLCLAMTACNADPELASNSESTFANLTPEVQFESLNGEFDDAMKEFATAYRAASESERPAIFENQYPKANEYVAKFMKIAEENPGTDAAFDSLSWIVLRANDEAATEQAYETLWAEYIDHEKMKDVCMGLGSATPSQKLLDRLNELIDKNPRSSVKAAATFSLAMALGRINEMKAGGDASEFIASVDASDDRIEKLYNVIVNDYPDANVLKGNKRTYRSMAEGALFEMHNLAIGMEAPEIESKDLDGVSFKLSEYRGKVVLLDFWGDWWAPCRAMYSHERSLVKQLADKPFAIVGVNSDKNREKICSVVNEKNISWRSFWNGSEGPGGHISTKWNVSSWPTTYLLDADGKIRFKNLRGEKMDKAITELMAEMGHDVDLTKHQDDDEL